MMSAISNDTDFRKALDGLDDTTQRKVGADFVESVLDLNSDERVKEALKVAREGGSEEFLSAVFKNAKKASLDSHARCGSEGDWAEQAAYFVARAATAVVAPPGQSKSDNAAWLAAVNARMARTCESIDAAEDAAGQESARQYRVLADYLKH